MDNKLINFKNLILKISFNIARADMILKLSKLFNVYLPSNNASIKKAINFVIKRIKTKSNIYFIILFRLDNVYLVNFTTDPNLYL